jgi:ABC-2 type transport system ATP-binding protein
MLLRTEQLTKDYGNIRALDRLDLTVAPGEVFGLLGPNGSGKSTALRLLLGFLRPTAGAAWIDGHHCWDDSVRARRRVAYLPGELRLYENMTGRQLIRFLSDAGGGPPGPQPRHRPVAAHRPAVLGHEAQGRAAASARPARPAAPPG